MLVWCVVCVQCVYCICVVWYVVWSCSIQKEDRVREGIKMQLKGSFLLRFLTIQIGKILYMFGISLVSCKVKYTPFMECELQFYPNYLFRKMT